MGSLKVLIVDDEELHRKLINEALQTLLQQRGFFLKEAADEIEALEFCESFQPELVVLDMRLHHTDMKFKGARAVLKHLHAKLPETRVILVSAVADEREVNELFGHTPQLKRHFVPKLIEQGDCERALRAALSALYKGLLNESSTTIIGGASPATAKLLQKIHRVAVTDFTLFLAGNSGTGKTHFARYIHELSPRHKKPFLKQNCAELRGELTNSALFGVVAGVATGVVAAPGIFEEAKGGTVFLDEIDKLPLETQSKLLLVLNEDQQKFVKRIGSAKEIPVNFRLLYATNANLEAAVQEGKFLKDLYNRINSNTVEIPALNSRREDIPALVYHLLATQVARQVPENYYGGITQQAVEWLQQQDWQAGEIRRLFRVLKEAVEVSEGQAISEEIVSAAWSRVVTKSTDTPPEVELLDLPIHAAEDLLFRLSVEDKRKKRLSEKEVYEALGLSSAAYFKRTAKLGIQLGSN
jgi:DNA-binding NtrC family response regulator